MQSIHEGGAAILYLHRWTILGLYWDNGKENGNYRDYRGYIGTIRVYIGVVLR